MKNSVFLLLFIFSVGSYAQQWPADNAHWTYCGLGYTEWDIMCCAGPIDVYYTHDTIIGTETYQISETELYSNYYYMTRYSNDTVYRWVNNQEYLFYHFQMQMGEVITTYRSVGGTDDTSCTSVLPLEVIDSTTVIINGQNLTQWILRDTLGFDPYNEGSPFYAEYWVYDQLGPASFPWFYSYAEDIGCEILFDAGYTYLDGYEDGVFPTWIANCPTASVNENEMNTTLVYPNPSNNELFTDLPFENYAIYTTDGRIVVQGNKLSTNAIDVSAIAPGVYHLHLTYPDEITARASFVKE